MTQKLDKYSQTLLGILLLSTLDAIFTLLWLQLQVGEEANPILDYFLQIGPVWFISAKAFLTLSGCFILYQTRHALFSKKAATGLFLVYVAVCIYHALGALYVFTN